MLDAKGVMEPYREPRGSRGWFILVLGVVVFAAFGGVVGYAYVHGLPGIGGEPPLIHAETEPYRHAPSDRGGLAVANASSSIVSVLRPTDERPRVERLLPPENSVALQPPAPPAPLPVPAPAPAPTAPDNAERTAVEPDTAAPSADSAQLGVPVPQVRPPAPDQLAAREPPAIVVAPPQAAPAPPAPVRTPPVVSAPAPAPAAAAAPRQLTPATAAPAPQRAARIEPAAPPTPRASSSAAIYRLQLAAVRSDGGLNQAWADLRQRYPSALGAVNSQVERTDTTTGPLYRLQAGPFPNREAAATACATIKANGGQCFIVGPITP